MREKLLLVAGVALLALTTLVLATLQTSLWFQIFGWFPAPAFWMPALVFVALYRAPVEMIISVFVISLILSTMTVMPDGLLFMSLLTLGGAIRLVKQRFYWTGSSYFMMVSGFAALAWHTFHWAGSLLTSETPLVNPEIADWLIQALLTPLIAPPLYDLFRWFDKLIDRDQIAEASTDIL